MAYGIFESTNIKGRNWTFRGDVDIENGMLVTKGALITKDIYKAVLPATATLEDEPVYVVGHPAGSYDSSSATNKNENGYINKAGKNFRVYELAANDRFAIADYGIDLTGVGGNVEAGQFVGLANGSGKPVASAAKPTGSAFIGEVIEVKNQGNTYFVGTEVDLRITKVVISVIQNG